MQTQLAPQYQGTPDGQAAEAILRKCVHCGFCTATCPTYQLLGDELDGLRGRIYLMKQVLEGAVPTRKTQAHRPLPDLPQLRNHLPQRRAIRPLARHRSQAGRCPGAAPGG
jgi:ferredoxin